MKKTYAIVALALACFMFAGGCTAPSTRLAQDGSFRTQAVTDGVHRDMFGALSRENFETARLNILLEAEKSKQDATPEVRDAITKAANRSILALTEFAIKRDKMVEWDRDHERANALKYVTVDAKLFSEQGILNYIGGRLSDGAKALFKSWDAGKQSWNATTQPAATDAMSKVQVKTMTK
jgi:hypothetical protein